MKPLESMKVIEVAFYLPAPMTGLVLSDLGADVVKIESPPDGDPLRVLGGGFSKDGGKAFHAFNRGKRSCMLDLKSEAGLEAFRRLAGKADVLLVSMRPSALRQLGIDFASVEKLNPRIVYCSITGYGMDGPWVDRAGHDINYQAASGILHLARDDEGSVVFPPVPLCDIFGSFHGAVAVLAGLLERGRTGRGTSIDISMAESAMTVNLFNMALTDIPGESFAARGRMLSGRYPFYNVYATKDRRWLALGAIEGKFWRRFCELIGRADLVGRQFDTGAVGEVRAVLAARTLEEWKRLFAPEDVCLDVIPDYEAVIASPQHVFRKAFAFNDEKLLAFGFFPFSPDPLRLRAPKPGEHTRQVLEEAGVPRSILEKAVG